MALGPDTAVGDNGVPGGDTATIRTVNVVPAGSGLLVILLPALAGTGTDTLPVAMFVPPAPTETGCVTVGVEVTDETLVDDIDAGVLFAVDAVVLGAFPDAAGRKRMADAVLPCVSVAVTTGDGCGNAVPD